MDYTSLISLALVTIIFTTFIAPILSKLSTLREEIADTKFPIKTDEPNIDDEINGQGVILSKKLTQYATKYDEVWVFLKFFYAIIAVVFLVQFISVFTNKHSAQSFLPLSAALAVIIILSLALRKFLLPPWKLRSIPWLSHAGIAPVYTKHLFGPTLVLNNRTSNNPINDTSTRFNLEVAHYLTGFWYILTIESTDGRSLYYVSAGRAYKHLDGGSLVSPDGQQTYDMSIANTDLKANDYKARLLVFIAPFSGIYSPTELITKFNVPESGPAKRAAVAIDLNLAKTNYTFTVKKNQIVAVDYNEGPNKEEGIHALITSPLFFRYFRKAKRPFTLADRHGNLDRHTIHVRLARRKIMKSRILRWRKRPSKRSTYLNIV